MVFTIKTKVWYKLSSSSGAEERELHGQPVSIISWSLCLLWPGQQWLCECSVLKLGSFMLWIFHLKSVPTRLVLKVSLRKLRYIITWQRKRLNAVVPTLIPIFNMTYICISIVSDWTGETRYCVWKPWGWGIDIQLLRPWTQTAF